MLKTKIIILLLSLLTFQSTLLKSQTVPEVQDSIKEDTEKFTEENLLKYMEEIGIKYINFTIAQAIHESARFRSKRFIQDNNMFGMKQAQTRKTTAIGTRNGYAIYESWKKSVEDFYLMQSRILIRHTTKASYIAYIARNYAADPLYMRKLQKYIKHENNN